MVVTKSVSESVFSKAPGLYYNGNDESVADSVTESVFNLRL